MRPWPGVLRLSYNMLRETEFPVFQFTFDIFFISHILNLVNAVKSDHSNSILTTPPQYIYRHTC